MSLTPSSLKLNLASTSSCMLVELAPEVSLAEITEATGAPLTVS